MESTLSVSKGVFVYKNGFDRQKYSSKKENAISRFGGVLSNNIVSQAFYEVYSSTWETLQAEIEVLHQQSNSKTLEHLLDYVVHESSDNIRDLDEREILPAVALLTGVNQPDHLGQFIQLSKLITKRIAAHVCMLQARDCATIKSAVETLVYNIIEQKSSANEKDERDKPIRRSQCNLKQLYAWYRNNYICSENSFDESDEFILPEKHSKITAPALIVILPDFECFSVTVLQDLILLLSAQRLKLPFMLILGVATSLSAVQNTLAFHVTSKIKLRIFQTQTAPDTLNEVNG